MKIIKIILCMLLLIVVLSVLGYITVPAVRFIINDELDRIIHYKNYKPEEYFITGQYGDRFCVVKNLRSNYPVLRYNFKLYYEDGDVARKPVARFSDVKTFDLKGIYNEQNLKCYLFMEYMIYKYSDDNNFKSVSLYDLDNDIAKYTFLVPCVRTILQKDRRLVYTTSEILAKSKDNESIDLLKRYAKGEFTEEELNWNSNSDFTSQEVQEACKEALYANP